MDLLVRMVDRVVVEQEQDQVVQKEMETLLLLVLLKVMMVEQELIVNQTLDVHLLKLVAVAVVQTLQEIMLLVHHQGQKLQDQEEMVLLIQLQDLL